MGVIEQAPLSTVCGMHPAVEPLSGKEMAAMLKPWTARAEAK